MSVCGVWLYVCVCVGNSVFDIHVCMYRCYGVDVFICVCMCVGVVNDSIV